MVDGLVVSALNHLLQSEPWAQERLRAHAGAQAVIRTGVGDLHLKLDTAGLFLAGSPEQPAAVMITLPVDTPVRLLTDRKSLFQAAKLSGSADLAEALAFVFRNLRWDVEADLARVLGDIPAHRLESVRASVVKQAQVACGRVFRNLTEYASEDTDWLVPRRDIKAFEQTLDVLRADLAQLEGRLERL